MFIEANFYINPSNLISLRDNPNPLRDSPNPNSRDNPN